MAMNRQTLVREKFNFCLVWTLSVKFISPFVVRIKCLLQQLWTKELGWDKVFSNELQQNLLQWYKEISLFSELKIPSYYFPNKKLNFDNVQLHVFGDANPACYGAVAYFRLKKGVHLTIVLIESAHIWRPFVANRVTEIQEHTDLLDWRHCDRKKNPANLITRGCHAEELLNSTKWFYEPPFLSLPEEKLSPSKAVKSQNERTKIKTRSLISLCNPKE
ncbi:integrase catalytic domain-containing protein [Nephila pilipes]|uniref:Integrase catalytic domain-containing protein n=1 Tax=Nephila pilipes TaxID=299642 RepID=A0A8X6U6T9_NEPPI|nr:integrase catalytic domain-containing protein [Nephila pilipes]